MKHKKEVLEDRIKTREEMITQLYNIRRGRGGMSEILDHKYISVNFRTRLYRNFERIPRLAIFPVS